MRGRSRVLEVITALKQGKKVLPRGEIEILILCRGAKNAVERNRIRRRVRAGLKEITRRRDVKNAVIIVKAGREYLTLPWESVLKKLEGVL